MSIITSGSFTSDGAARRIEIISDFDEFRLVNITDVGSAAAATPVMRAYFSSLMPNGSAYLNLKTNGAATLALESMITTLGFTPFDDSVQTPEAAVTGTAITAANPAVVTMNAHGYSTGDRVVLSNCTGMRQIEGMVFTITRINANSFSLPLDASGFAAPATAVTARRLPNLPLFSPRRFFIGGITAANPGVVSITEATDLEVGDKVTFSVPRVTAAAFGMTQLTNVQAEITAIAVDGVNGADLLTLDIDTSGFTAFAFPASASVPFTFPQIIPVGEVATKVTNPERNIGSRGIIVGTGVQTTAKLYQWFAIKSQ